MQTSQPPTSSNSVRVHYVELSYEDWRAQYRPIKNPFDPDASFHGCLLDISPLEKQHIVTADHAKIWTLLDGDGAEFIASGWHFANRTGWFLTEVPVPPRTEVTVVFSDFPNDI